MPVFSRKKFNVVSAPSWLDTPLPPFGCISFGISFIVSIIPDILLKTTITAGMREVFSVAFLFYCTVFIYDLFELKQRTPPYGTDIFVKCLRALVSVLFGFVFYKRNGGAITLPFSGNIIALGIWYIPCAAVVVLLFSSSVGGLRGARALSCSVCFPVAIFLMAGGIYRQGHSSADVISVTCFVIGIIFGFLPFCKKISEGRSGREIIAVLISAAAFISGFELLLIIAALPLILNRLSVLIQTAVFLISGKKKKLFRITPLDSLMRLEGFNDGFVYITFVGLEIITSSAAYIISRGL